MHFPFCFLDVDLFLTKVIKVLLMLICVLSVNCMLFSLIFPFTFTCMHLVGNTCSGKCLPWVGQ